MKGLMIETDLSSKTRCGGRCRILRQARLSTVATSRIVSVRTLLILRACTLVSMVVGGIWLSWRPGSVGFDGDPPALLCLPDWSYLTTTVYFLMAVMACLRQFSANRLTPRSSSSTTTSGRFASSPSSTATHILLEISVVFQTISVPLAWIDSAQSRRHDGWAVLCTVSWLALLSDLLLNRSRVEAKHLGIIFTYLLVWVMEQIAWVYANDAHSACYETFDLRGVKCVYTAAIGAIVVVAVVLAYVALCAQRDALSTRCAGGLRPDANDSVADLEEDVGNETTAGESSALPPRCTPTTSDRSSIINPLFAGSGSRMNRSWPHICYDRKGTMGSSATDLSSIDEIDVAFPEGGNPSRPATVVAPVPAGVGRRADWGAGVAAHPSSWAGYGGAAAWVRTNRDAPPTTRSSKVASARKGPPRF